MAERSRIFGVFGAISRWILRLFLAIAVLLAGLIIAYRFMPPISTLMMARMLLHETVMQHFVPLDSMSPHLLAAVVMSEDAHFCRHHGVDWGAMREVIDEAGIDGPSRGASTITMQTAKNLFLWPGRSYVRKGLEIPLALLVELAWPKHRILELYLNIAEWGDGIFGAEAAANKYFNESAADLDLREAALLAAVLPDPHRRNVLRPSRHVAIHARIVTKRVEAAGDFLSCLK